MQREPEPVHHQPDPPERFPGRRFRAAHGHKIIGVPDQFSQLATPRRPDPIQFIQVDIGQQWRDHAPYTKGNFQFERTVAEWRERYSLLDLRRKS